MKVILFFQLFIFNIIFDEFQVFGSIDTREKPVELENVNTEILKKV